MTNGYQQWELNQQHPPYQSIKLARKRYRQRQQHLTNRGRNVAVGIIAVVCLSIVMAFQYLPAIKIVVADDHTTIVSKLQGGE